MVEKPILKSSNSIAQFDKYFKWSIILAIVAVQVYGLSNGLFLTGDSYSYIAASESLKKDFSLVDTNGHYFLFWPPLYPILLTVIGTGYPLIIAHIVASVFIALMLYRMTDRIFFNKFYQFVCLISILLGIHLLLISKFVWSELFFLLLMLIFLDMMIQSMDNRRLLIFAILFGCLMCLQRNAGLFIVAGVSFWFFINEKEWKHKLIKPSIFILCVCFIPITWNVIVWFLVPHPHFDLSGDFFRYAFYNLSSLVIGLMNAFIPVVYLRIPVFAVIASFVVLVPIFFWIVYQSFNNASVKLFFVVVCIYLVGISLVFVINIAGFPVDIGEAERFLSVIMPLISILFFKALESFNEKQKPYWKMVMLIVIISWAVYPLSRTIKNAVQWHSGTG
jgi:hypothetical protein